MQFKEKLANSTDRLSAVMCTIPSAVVPQAVAAAGVDAVVIDLEQGAVDIGTAHAMIAASQACAPLVRVPDIDEVIVKRVLDMGAEGIVFPLIRSAQDAERAIASMRYPPEGTRGFGPFIAQSRWNTDFAGYPNLQNSLVTILTIETRDAVECIDEICAVPGIDLIVPAPFDLTAELGIMGQLDHPDYLAAIARVEAASIKAGIPLGTIARTKPQAEVLFARGHRFIADFDVFWLRDKATDMTGWCSAP